MYTLDRRRLLVWGATLAASKPLSSLAACFKQPVLNPVIFQRADPWITRDQKGRYLFTASVPEYDRIILRRSDSVQGLSLAQEKTIWLRPAKGRMGGHIWAPEIHLIDGCWYIYFAAGNSDEVFHIRTYVLKCDGADPMADSWSLVGQLETPWDTFTLDCTSFTHRGVNYLCWAQQEPGIDTNSNLYLAPISSPTKLAAKPTRLTVPTLGWETKGYKVNEGPALLARNGQLFLTYSASATDARYCMGMLSARDDADIMDPAAWTKSPKPVFKSAPENRVYGPGHNSFTTDDCGNDLLVYHARSYERIIGDPLYDPNRHTRIQQIAYDSAGRPKFGKPVGAGPLD